MGVVLGQYGGYTDYIQAANSIGANALNLSPSVYNFFQNQGQWLTLNGAFLNASISRGQQFFTSSEVSEATGTFFWELQYLISKGIGPDS
jgi:hypothetical protein